MKLEFGILAALQVPTKTSFWECWTKSWPGAVLELDFCILAVLHVAIKRGAPILERPELSEMHKKVQGQDLAPDPLKRAFFNIEIRLLFGC